MRALSVVALLALAGCGDPQPVETPDGRIEGHVVARVYDVNSGAVALFRIDDHERGVTCYVQAVGGVDCMEARPTLGGAQ